MKQETRTITGINHELGRYTAAIRLHWRLILSIGFFFGWLLSFPMQGPLFGVLVQEHNLNPHPLTIGFLLSHFLGLVTGGISGYYFKKAVPWFTLGSIPCLAVTLLIEHIPTEIWQLNFVLTGFFSGLAIIGWGDSFTRSVASVQRGRTFAASAIIANLILYLVILGTRVINGGW
ncbi:MAG: hypothetical protein NUV31_10020, partial [Dehalococcoidales bacterium]|nr:hypothetical protein [Dehalococcoidales bacterium]